MNVLGDLVFRMGVDLGRLNRDMRSARSVVDGAMTGIAKSASMATRALQGMIGALSVRELARISDQFKTINATLAIATKSAQAGALAYQQVLDTAMKTGQALDSVAITYRRFAENARELGITQDQVARATRTVSQSLALSGGSYQSTQAALLQFSQALASGQLRGQELNSVLEQSPRLARLIADGMQVPIGALRSLAEQGKITSEVIVAALESQADAIETEFAQLPMTFTRAMNNIQSAVTNLVGQVDQGLGIFGLLAEGIDFVAQNLDKLVNVVTAGLLIAFGRMLTMVAALAAAKLSLAASVGVLTAANMAFTRSMAILGGPAGVVVTAVSAMYAFRNEIGLVTDDLGKSITAIDEFKAGIQATGSVFDALILIGTTNPFNTIQEQVAKYSAEVNRLKEEQATYSEEVQRWLGTAKNLENATQRLAYFTNLEAIALRRTTQARIEAATATDTHTAAYMKMREGAEKILSDLEREYIMLGMTNAERREYIALTALENLGVKAGTELYNKYAGMIIEVNKRIDEREKGIQLAKDAAAAAKREAEEYRRLIETLDQQIARMQLENETFGQGNAARERAIFLRELENVKIEDRNRLLMAYDEAAATRAALEAHKRSIDERLKEEEKFARQVEKISDQIGQSLSDAIMNGGKNAKELLVNLFKTLILRPILQPIITGVTGALMSGFAGSAMAQAGGATSSMAQSAGLLGAVGAVKTVFDGFMGGFQALGASFTNIGVELGSQFIADFGYGFGQGFTSGSGVMANSGAMLGAAANAAAGIAGGIALGNLISGNLKIGGSQYLATGGGAVAGAIIGSIVPGLGTALGAIIGGALGGVINRAFGTGPREVENAGIRGLFTAGGTRELEQFERWTRAGGWFTSRQRGMDLRAVGDEIRGQFDQALLNIGQSVTGLVKTIGQSAENINEFSQFMEIDFKGMSPEQINERIASVMSEFGDNLTSFLIPSIAEFSRGNETAFQTLTRLSGTLTAVNNTFSALGYKLQEVSLSGAQASQRLVDLFGGIEKFTASTNFYYENFYSEQERVNFQTQQLTDAFASMGLAIPKTREQFRALVDTVQAIGDDVLFANILSLAPSFKNLETAIAQLASGADGATSSIANAAKTLQQIAQERVGLENRILQLQGNTAELRRRELNGLDESNRALQQLIYDIEDAQEASDKARQALDRSAQAEQQRAQLSHTQELDRLRRQFDATSSALEQQKQVLSAAKQVADESARSLRSLFDYLQQEINGLLRGVNALLTPEEGLRFIRRAIETATTTGYLPDEQLLRDAVKAAQAGITTDRFATSFEFQRASFRLAGDLMRLQEIAQAQMKIAEEQSAQIEPDLRAIDRQLDSAEQNYNSQVSMLQSQHNQSMQAAQAQINSIEKVDGSIMSLSEAILMAMKADEELKRLMATKLPTAGDGTMPGGSDLNGITISRLDSINKMYLDLLDREADKIGAGFWDKSELTLKQIGEEIKNSTEYAVRSAYKLFLGRKVEEDGLNFWLSSGLTRQQITEQIRTSEEALRLRGFANGGYYSGGMALVGENGPELINFDRGGMVYNAPQTAKMLNGGVEVAEEIKGLREENKVQARAMVQLQARMTRLLERWDGDGIPEERVVTA